MTSTNSNIKTCLNCKQPKHLSEFHKDKSKKDGRVCYCIPCAIMRAMEYNRTKDGVVTKIYSHQKEKSKRRHHEPPAYSKSELHKWMFSQPVFHKLFEAWRDSGYQPNLKPSCDRLNDYKHYAFDNLQVITWGENNQKAHDDRRSGANNKVSKSVIQLTREGEFVNKFYSQNQACRVTGIHYGSIAHCCNGHRRYAGGFVWVFA